MWIISRRMHLIPISVNHDKLITCLPEHTQKIPVCHLPCGNHSIPISQVLTMSDLHGSSIWSAGVFPMFFAQSPFFTHMNRCIGVYTYQIYSGWWFQPLWKIWKSVGNWDDYSQYMERHKIHVPNHQPDLFSATDSQLDHRQFWTACRQQGFLRPQQLQHLATQTQRWLWWSRFRVVLLPKTLQVCGGSLDCLQYITDPPLFSTVFDVCVYYYHTML